MDIEKLLLKGEEIRRCKNYFKALEEYHDWCKEIKCWVESGDFSLDKVKELSVKMHYEENEFSEDDGKKTLNRVVEDVSDCVSELDSDKQFLTDIPKKTASSIIEKVLKNFYSYYKAMFINPVHKKGTLQIEKLNEIKVGNEYDLQRMLYAILLPLFPTARLEVNSDNGYSGMRADIYFDEYDLVIELKCTGKNMTEKKLTEQLGADGFHYKAKIIFMFIYDADNIIKNADAYERAFMREHKTDGKKVRAFVLQPTVI